MVGVNIACNQREIAIIVEHRVIAVDDLHRVIDALEKQKIVSEIVDPFTILRQLLDHLITEIR